MSDEIDLIAEEQESEIKKSDSSRKIWRIAIMGDDDNEITTALKIILDHREIVTNTFDDIDSAVNFQPDITFLTNPIKLLKNDTLDDSVILDEIKKLETHTSSLVIVKSVISPDILMKFYSLSLSEDFWNERFVYWPEIQYDWTVEKFLVPDLVLLGGSKQACNNIFSFFEFFGNYVLQEKTRVFNVHDAVFAALSVYGYYGIIQTYMNQLNDTLPEFPDVNFPMVRSLLNATIVNTPSVVTIPTHIRAKHQEGLNNKAAKSHKGEYLNNNIKLFGSMTDRLPLMDEVINFKNLQEKE